MATERTSIRVKVGLSELAKSPRKYVADLQGDR